jgi:hypothetical protein
MGPIGPTGPQGPAGAIPDVTTINARLAAIESTLEVLDPIDQELNKANLPFAKGGHYIRLLQADGACRMIGDGYDFTRIIYIYANTVFPGTISGKGAIGYQNPTGFVPAYATDLSITITAPMLNTWCNRNSYPIR